MFSHKQLIQIGISTTIATMCLSKANVALSTTAIFRNQAEWQENISGILITENFDLEDSPSGFIPLLNKTTFSSGLSLLPQQPLEVTLFNSPDINLSSIGIEFNKEGELNSPIVVDYQFPSPVLGFGFDIGNPGTFFEEVNISIDLPENESITESFGFFPEFREEFLGIVVDKPITSAQVEYEVILFDGQFGNTTLTTSELIFAPASTSTPVPEPGTVGGLLVLSLGWFLKKQKA